MVGPSSVEAKIWAPSKCLQGRSNSGF